MPDPKPTPKQAEICERCNALAFTGIEWVPHTDPRYVVYRNVKETYGDTASTIATESLAGVFFISASDGELAAINMKRLDGVSSYRLVKGKGKELKEAGWGQKDSTSFAVRITDVEKYFYQLQLFAECKQMDAQRNHDNGSVQEMNAIE